MSLIVKLAPSKHAYGTLDALRGVAAIAVVAFHSPDLFGAFSPRSGWLAVDLFFCLSGFVIAHAYGSKLETGLSLRPFLWLRLVRLYPLFLLSILFAVVTMIAAARFGHGSTDQVSSILPSLLFLPTPFAGTLYPLNLPAWSLLMEIVINVIAALVWRHLTLPILLIIVAVSAGTLIWIAGPLASLDAGGTWPTLHIGLVRVSFSFFAGAALYRLRRFVAVKIPAFALVAGLLAILFLPATLPASGQLLVIIVAFPLLVVFGAAVEPRLSRPSVIIGRLSYGIYLLHWNMLGPARAIFKRADLRLPAPALGLTFLLILILSCWFADRFYDQPIRRKLLRRWRSSVGPKQTAF